MKLNFRPREAGWVQDLVPTSTLRMQYGRLLPCAMLIYNAPHLHTVLRNRLSAKTVFLTSHAIVAVGLLFVVVVVVITLIRPPNY